MREDGATVDKVILSNDPAYTPPTGSDPGPAESSLRGSTEHLLTVKNGSGDGFYGSLSIVSVTADPPPPGHIFDRWTGDISQLAAATDAATFLTMPGTDSLVTATYRLDPALDSDDDGLPDDWESTYFGNLSPTRTSDTDGDGQTDFAEYRAGTHPRNPGSRLAITHFRRLPNGDLEVSWDSVAGRRYVLRGTTDFESGPGLPIAAGIVATPPENSCILKVGNSVGFVRVDLE